jgi:hypothetical protein
MAHAAKQESFVHAPEGGIQKALLESVHKRCRKPRQMPDDHQLIVEQSVRDFLEPARPQGCLFVAPLPLKPASEAAGGSGDAAGRSGRSVSAQQHDRRGAE